MAVFGQSPFWAGQTPSIQFRLRYLIPHDQEIHAPTTDVQTFFSKPFCLAWETDHSLSGSTSTFCFRSSWQHARSSDRNPEQWSLPPDLSPPALFWLACRNGMRMTVSTITEIGAL